MLGLHRRGLAALPRGPAHGEKEEPSCASAPVGNPAGHDAESDRGERQSGCDEPQNGLETRLR